MEKRSREEGKERVLKMAKENDVKFVRMWFTDILGFLKSFAITVEEFDGALKEGMGFDGSSIEGFARIDESVMLAAGLEGIEKNYKVPEPVEENVYELKKYLPIL